MMSGTRAFRQFVPEAARPSFRAAFGYAPLVLGQTSMNKRPRLDIRKVRQKKNVLSLQLARDRARQSRGGSNGHVSLSVSNSEATEFGNQRLLERLEAENAQLRGSVVDLLLQLQALRHDAG
jgi:hypothetical protein